MSSSRLLMVPDGLAGERVDVGISGTCSWTAAPPPAPPAWSPG